jgi:hypothetical protein
MIGRLPALCCPLARALLVTGVSLLILLGGARAEAAADGVPATAASDEADGWFQGLQERVAETARAGRPVVLQAHVALCDNRIIACGAQGDGDSVRKNLYWTTSGGVVGWFRAQRAVWTEVAVLDGAPDAAPDAASDDRDVLQVRIYRATIRPGAAYARRGVTRPLVVYAVLYGWRGTAIDAALAAYFDDLYGCAPRRIRLPDGTELRAGGEAHLVAWIGHNRLMDLDRPELRALLLRTESCAAPPKGLIAMACRTASYLGRFASSAQRVPLLLTNDLLFAGTHAFEGAARAFVSGGSLADIHRAAAAAYAQGQRKPVGRVRHAFVNPAHPQWARFPWARAARSPRAQRAATTASR